MGCPGRGRLRLVLCGPFHDALDLGAGVNVKSAEESERYLDTLFKLTCGGRRDASLLDVFYAAMLPEPQYSPEIAANVATVLGYAEYLGGRSKLTGRGRRYCKAMRADRL